MNVLQVIDTLDAGGAEKLAVSYANALAKKGCNSFLCATRKEGLLKNQLHDDVGYLFLERTSTFDFKAISRLVTFIKKHKISIVHAHASSYFIVTLLKFRLPKLKFVWHDHYGKSEQLAQRKVLPIKMASLQMNAVIAVNDILEKWAIQKLFVKNVQFFSNFPVKNAQEEKQTFLKGTAGKRILCLANLRPQKDHHNLLEAFQEVHQTFPDWTLHLVGKDFEDDHATSVKESINTKQLTEAVFVYGSCPDVGHIVSQSEIGVLSSKSEGLPIALLEYGLHGLSSIATNVGQCDKVIPNDDYGFLVSPSNSKELMEQLIFLIKNTKERKTKGEKLQQYILDNFSEDAIIDKLLALYKQL